MTEDKKAFLEKVWDEIRMIQANATPEEIAKLDPLTFDHNRIDTDIFGQMTGCTHSNRARNIVPKTYNSAMYIEFKKWNSSNFEDFNFTAGNTYSALEMFLFMCDTTDHLDIIAYLKGEITELHLTIF